MQDIWAIAAKSENHFIGLNNQLPWDSPEDLKRFHLLTKNHFVLMGRKTFESIDKPLDGRINLVISRTKEFKGCHNFVTIEGAVTYFSGNKKLGQKLWIIGGGEIYKQTINLWEGLELTVINKKITGDTKFPKLPKNLRLFRLETYKDGTFLTYRDEKDFKHFPKQTKTVKILSGQKKNNSSRDFKFFSKK